MENGGEKKNQMYKYWKNYKCSVNFSKKRETKYSGQMKRHNTLKTIEGKVERHRVRDR